MDVKICVLVAASIFAFASVFTMAEVPTYCNQIPQPAFPDGTTVEKWGFLHTKNKCVKYWWNGDTSVKNYFDSEENCLNTCLPDAMKNVTIIQGVCVCRCPSCNSNNISQKESAKQPTTPKPTKSSGSIFDFLRVPS